MIFCGGGSLQDLTWSFIVFVPTISSKEGGGDGAMNLETGVFTSLTSGHYTLTLSGYSALDARVDNYLDLYHNGHMVTHHKLVRCRILTMSMSDYPNVITNMRKLNKVTRYGSLVTTGGSTTLVISLPQLASWLPAPW